jgi:hypothetical protein
LEIGRTSSGPSRTKSASKLAAFATIFGKVDSRTPTVRIDALPDDQGVLRMPHYTTDALSTDDGQP